MSKYLEESKIPIRISGTKKNGWPFILSLWYLYKDGKFYLATPVTAKVVSYLQNNPKCAFEVAGDDPPYCGIRGHAEAKILDSIGLNILKELLKRYIGDLESPLAKKLLSRDIHEVAIELNPKSIYQWDFTDRMKNSIKKEKVGLCP